MCRGIKDPRNNTVRIPFKSEDGFRVFHDSSLTYLIAHFNSAINILFVVVCATI